ncbi:MAG: siphovirus Gp157 family protein [Companilactobacillus sp.]|jgi:hypothetical protein|uniref:siphovirus Gp157 family protein n=1 Tax=Companilactobacillus sp. TaxID=2767905 RepID=UPI0025C50771|nr:siphovirus Gp157 family protein [Companilactobacillus sp.]MCH4010348.1 siphovirus Gp157 family protein [Companilactobacillus sp.]MCH4051976.1 siphovirus Gp157 family protein [Companilactobacillus sp.]MCH4075788.1 siphovirus Gp157 family protein [Companilactobacillus sp.]MCH4126866.1 siphovirus Gp157 family protein [Companilactobacillus sp.]
MATLYELTGSYLKLLEYAEDADPTLYHDTMDSITDAIEDKAVGYAKVDKELAKDEVALKEEAKRLSARATAIANNRKRLKRNLQDSMAAIGSKKIKTLGFTIYIQRNNPSVNILDEHEIPDYLYETKQVLDKKRISTMFKEGKDVPGAELTHSESLRYR